MKNAIVAPYGLFGPPELIAPVVGSTQVFFLLHCTPYPVCWILRKGTPSNSLLPPFSLIRSVITNLAQLHHAKQDLHWLHSALRLWALG